MRRRAAPGSNETSGDTPDTEATRVNGSARPSELSNAKKRFLKVKAKIAAGQAFASAGEQRSKREKRKANNKFGWLAKDITVGHSCNPSKFDFSRVIGTGLMGTVRLARYKKDDMWCVVKSIRKDYVTRHHDGRHVQNERKILNDLDHPFVVRLFGTFQDQKRIYFVMEYVVGGELFSRLSKKEKFSANTAKFYLTEIFLALEYVHDCGYAYRDLKPENILLDEDGHCKLVDFGFSRAPNEQGLMRTQVGTPAYLSPEQLNGKFTGGYSRIVDWWSLGIILYELLTGKTPFCKSNRETPYAIYLRVLKGRIWFPMSFDAKAKALIRSLLTADIEKRLREPEHIREDSFFEGIDFEAAYERRLVPPHVPRIGEPGDSHYFDDYPEEQDSADKNPIDQSLFTGF